MDGLDADDARNITEAHRTADDNARINAADKAEFQHAVLGDLFDDHADLVHVCAHGDRTVERLSALAEDHHVAEGVGPDLVREGLDPFEHERTHRVLTAGRAGQCAQFLH